MSCRRIEIPAFHYMIGVAGGATLRCAEYATFGTQALSRAMLVALEDRTACLLANHGMVCYGPSLAKALWLAVEIETLCKQYVIACQSGVPVILDDAEMERVLARFKTYGKQPAADGDGAGAGADAPVRRDG
ncbi:Ribulose-5-phosphate 4-epimerase [Roseibacterium elongatum DSM 19469]|uniref:Ribulose-5-phosphate 4-epimerase n=1 Tax=Roseicyclus elongatus DSM 19469 TaxID=1294273 RepID=W8S966_9RHOB|nr:Ribulose-5-phosphate 4-epimerase [Roseibacterium elongatum DSM 19469]